MQAFTKLLSLLPLLSFALATPLEQRDITQEFNITSLHGKFPSADPYGTGPIDSNLDITITYVDPKSTTGEIINTTCSYSWPKIVTPGGTDWTSCKDSSVEWRLPKEDWYSCYWFRVQVYQTLASDGSGLEASHKVIVKPSSGDPDAYLSCLDYGKFTPYECQLGGTLSARSPPVVMVANKVTSKPE